MTNPKNGPWFQNPPTPPPPSTNDPIYPKPQDSRPAPDDVPPGD